MKIAIDFDGTCVDHRFPEVGPEVPSCCDVLNWLYEEGNKLILYTMRSRGYLEKAIQWFEDRQIHLYGIQFDKKQLEWTSSNKCYAEIYIDDAALGCPLITVAGFNRRCVDWLKVKEIIKKRA